MPTKFRKNVWIKRGDFVVVTPIEEGDKVKAEICTILYKDQIRFIKSENQWPEGFSNQEDAVKDGLSKLDIKEEKNSDSETESEEDDSDLFQNTNRQVYEVSEEESETNSESEENQ